MISTSLSPSIRNRSLSPSFIYRCFYDIRTKNDTIFAPASHITTNKGSPLAVIRLSGSKCQQAASIIAGVTLSGNRDESLSASISRSSNKLINPRLATVVKFRDLRTNDIIDRGIILWFPSPNSYTGEDVCEFHLHGSQAIMTSLLSTLGGIPGFRPADPGEFTRRAVSNGKISLIQAESLPDLIASQTEYQRKLAFRGLEGKTRDKYKSWISALIQILAHLEASIDFGEDELIGEAKVVGECLDQIRDLTNDIMRFIDIGTRSRELSITGARVAILGRPNAGKSSLMNYLCRREKSIVSNLSGTTRDVIEHSFEFGGHLITLCDTAGLNSLNMKFDSQSITESLQDKHNKIEQEGMRRAIDTAKKSDIIVFLIDGYEISDSLESIDALLSEFTEVLNVVNTEGNSLNIHLVINKIDLSDKLLDPNFVELFESKVREKFELPYHNIATSFISCTLQKNFDILEKKLICLLESSISSKITSPDLGNEGHGHHSTLEYVNERHLAMLNSVRRHLSLAGQLDLSAIDEMAQHVRESVDYLSRIVGTISNEQVFDVIFRDFCIGK